MFTGIIESAGRILNVSPSGGNVRLRVDAGPLVEGLKLGASIAVSGVCLTACQIQGSVLEFDVIPETLDRSTLGALRPGDQVNLERSLAVGDRLDGHFVQGHVEGRAAVRQRIENQGELVLWLAPEPGLIRYVVPKGSVAVDGVSLTVAAVRENEFSVALIPTTLERTTLGRLREGDAVNIETDILVRTLVHRLEALRPDSGITFEKLVEAGYA